jgi:hypothetical protein
LPDLLIIDGGKGQLGIAREVLADLQVQGVQLLGIAKGPSRRPGLETLYLDGHSESAAAATLVRPCTSCSTSAMKHTVSPSPDTDSGGRKAAHSVGHR